MQGFLLSNLPEEQERLREKGFGGGDVQTAQALRSVAQKLDRFLDENRPQKVEVVNEPPRERRPPAAALGN